MGGGYCGKVGKSGLRVAGCGLRLEAPYPVRSCPVRAALVDDGQADDDNNSDDDCCARVMRIFVNLVEALLCPRTAHSMTIISCFWGMSCPLSSAFLPRPRLASPRLASPRWRMKSGT